MSDARFLLSVGEPWNFTGPDGDNCILVSASGLVFGPAGASSSQPHLLLSVDLPFELGGELVTQLVAGARHHGESAGGVAEKGGEVSVARVRPGYRLERGSNFALEAVNFCIVGTLRLQQ